MPAEIATGRFCADYFSDFDVPSSKGDVVYRVSLGGTTHVHCSCAAFRFFKGPESGRTCKHIAFVWEHACLWNEQWCDGKDLTLRPVPGTCDYPIIEGETCPHCDGPVVPVRIAV